ncbi:cysteinyl-tRNA synthetase [Planoprotostelium fungivorum]|uniref:cysteine--tRNA ligase n=1 Tax=Planoprotostelium fungivorum TaxID=1890364 RepID=A0A2P6N020_9EUKA|nr:cysteinyl-tRNA synthetase [Planoprotostelium fungivorum]
MLLAHLGILRCISRNPSIPLRREKNPNLLHLTEKGHSSCKPVSKWNLPTGIDTGIKVKNSLTSEKRVPLISPNGKKLTWCVIKGNSELNKLIRYTCGPTVYDAAHLGHARSYVSVDILQRILTDYYNIDVFHMMGMTDVDDKIINKAKETGRSIVEVLFPVQKQIHCRQVSRHYEKEFLQQMEALNVRTIQCVADRNRVSEHIEDITRYVETIIGKGAAYAVNGSVYFSMDQYKGYGKLLASVDHITPEGEVETKDKRNPKDFALWKAAKDGEPSWPSPWGQGRPGWHIECSTMIWWVICYQLRGIDLKFPHHENEIAQCSAFLDLKEDQNWANYFMHTGHLHISGRKMSKSLKNFITIEELLNEYTAEQFRIYCLMHHYGANIEFSRERMNEAVLFAKRLQDFITETLAKIHRNADSPKKWSDGEFQLSKTFNQVRDQIQSDLSDDFNTPAVLKGIMHLTNTLNVYMNVKSGRFPPELPTQIVYYITRIYSIFGLNSTHVHYKPQLDKKTVDILIEFRSMIKGIALRGEEHSKILSACDQLREKVLPEIGVQIRDQKEGPAVWQYTDPDILKQQQEIKIEEMFKNDAKYGAFDDEGELISESSRAKLKKNPWVPVTRQVIIPRICHSYHHGYLAKCTWLLSHCWPTDNFGLYSPGQYFCLGGVGSLSPLGVGNILFSFLAKPFLNNQLTRGQPGFAFNCAPGVVNCQFDHALTKTQAQLNSQLLKLTMDIPTIIDDMITKKEENKTNKDLNGKYEWKLPEEMGNKGLIPTFDKR